MKGISIIICTFNGALRLPETLGYISKIKFAGDWELLIVDNASSDSTRKVTENFFDINPHVNGRIISETQPGLSHARKKGWQNAQYDLVLFCDDDNWLRNDYLTIGFNIFVSNNKVGVLGGCGEPVSDLSFPSWFSEFSHSYAIGNNGKVSGKLEKGSAHYGAGCFFLKKPLLQLDQMNVKLILTDRKGKELVSGGDVELCYLVQLLGFEIWFEESLRFQHFIPSSRLEWNYYRKLKNGIAASFPLLFSYKAIFEYSSKNELRNAILQKFWFSLKGYVLCQFRSISKPSKKNEVQLEENRQKISSFFRNYSDTMVHFDWLKKKF